MKLKHHRPPIRLKVANFGPIESADVRFGDLTVLVGPQATGKSIFLQLLKLLVDSKHVKHEFRRAGIDWGNRFNDFLEVYFGEGMRSLWKKEATRIDFPWNAVDLPALVQRKSRSSAESMFFVPAQRVLTLREGWPQAFNFYAPGVPFAVREFSEQLRLLMTDFGTLETLFPVPRRLKGEFRELIRKHIFPGFNLQVDKQMSQKRLVLSDGKSSLPFMVWSAGQREFVPLLLGLYYLLTPAGAPRRSGVDWVVIEELEMGLHPRAIGVVMLMVLELVARGYHVCLSTHSPQVLDAVWALQRLKENNASPASLLEVFDAPASMTGLAEEMMKRSAKVYYFDREGQTTRDISNLDPASDEGAEAGWGGLSEFAGRANDAVARAVAKSMMDEVNP